MSLIGGLAILLLVAAGALAYRRHAARGKASDAVLAKAANIPKAAEAGIAGAAAAATAAMQQPDGALLSQSSARAAQHLWRLAFAAPSRTQASNRIYERVRSNVAALLQVDTLDPQLFPRRPALLPQLLQAVNEPASASEKIARIIAHDPVLAADVLQLANSSLHRISSTPIETIQRAIVVCGVDALRSMLATVMLRPVFRATRSNFPRLPRMLWERTERATRAAELYALETGSQDRFEAQLAVLLGALGPLVTYGATLDVYARNPHLAPDADLCRDLITELSTGVSQHIARAWDTAPRLIDALDDSCTTPLAIARQVGELFGTLAFLESQTAISAEEREQQLAQAGLSDALRAALWAGIERTARPTETRSAARPSAAQT